MRGFTLVDVLVGAALASIIFIGIFGSFQLGFRVVRQTEMRIVAANIANEEMEMLRNLAYEDVGTVGAVIPYAEGTLEESKVVNRNDLDYDIETKVKYVIDPVDGVGGAEDTCPYDYKRVQVKAVWNGIPSGEVVFITDIAPDNLNEECLQDGGILKVNAFDAHGAMIVSPLIEILNPVNESVVDSATPDSGYHYFPLESGTYKIVVSKGNYSMSRTYGEDEITTPDKPHMDLEEGAMEEISFSIDRVSQISINTLTRVMIEGEEEVVPIRNVEFSLRGGKVVGWDSYSDPVYKYDQLLSTDATGGWSLLDMEWDNYYFSINPSTGLVLEEMTQPVEVAPNSTVDVDLYLTTERSLIVHVKDQSTDEPIFSSDVELENVGLTYLETRFTDEDGNAFFIPLEGATYNIQVAAPGYVEFNGTVPVTGNNTKIIILERIE